MKLFQTRLLLTLLAGSLAGLLTGQATVLNLYLKPDIQSPLVGQVSLDDSRLGQAVPVPDDAKAALGWHTAAYSGPVDGYVPDAKIGKDMLPVDDTPIYAAPADTSPVIAPYRTGARIEIVDTGLWWHIQLAGGMPVYFVLDTPPPLPAVTGFAEPVAAQPAAQGFASSSVAAAERPQGNAVQEGLDSPRPGVVGQTYQGTFRKSRMFLGLIPPKADFYLEGPDGHRLAWLETRGIVIPGSIKSFLDQPVIIHGERIRTGSSADWTIKVRNMRLK